MKHAKEKGAGPRREAFGPRRAEMLPGEGIVGRLAKSCCCMKMRLPTSDDTNGANEAQLKH
jgi:hypothetical protein